MSVAVRVIDPEGALPSGLADRLADSAVRCGYTGSPEEELLADLGGTGLFGVAVPVEHGGLGGDGRLVNHVVEQVARVNPSVSIMLFQHFAVSARIAEWGDEEQQARLLPVLARGDLVMATLDAQAHLVERGHDLAPHVRR